MTLDLTIRYELIACKAFIEKEFSSNYGDITGFNYPIDHNQV